MDVRKQQAFLDEITSLNADDLSIEELERRLELNMIMPSMMAPDCTNFTCSGFDPKGGGQPGNCSGFSCTTFG